jgi:hypothetical protein
MPACIHRYLHTKDLALHGVGSDRDWEEQEKQGREGGAQGHGDVLQRRHRPPTATGRGRGRVHGGGTMPGPRPMSTRGAAPGGGRNSIQHGEHALEGDEPVVLTGVGRDEEALLLAEQNLLLGRHLEGKAAGALVEVEHGEGLRPRLEGGVAEGGRLARLGEGEAEGRRRSRSVPVMGAPVFSTFH